MSLATYPQRVAHDSRICFGIDFFATEAEAKAAHAIVRERGDSYNGGMFDGMACGRDSGFDRTGPDGAPQYAVTVA